MTKPETLSDHELERTLLAALLADNSRFDRLGQLEPNDLADPMHAAVLTAALDLRSENRAVSVTTLRSRFASVPFGDDGSVLDYLKGCEFGGTAPDVGDVAVVLRELSQRREIVELGERIAGSVHDHAVGPGTLLTDAARSVDDLLAKCRPAGKTLWAMPEAVHDLLSASDDKDLCVPTRFTEFNNATSGGFRRGELGIIGGRPSMGKSALALAIARGVARAGYGVLFYSLEMQRRDCMRRMATDACWTREHAVSYQAARAGNLNERDRQAYEQGVKSLADLPLLIEEASGLLLSDIASGTRRTAERFERDGKRLGLVVVDHIGFLTPTNRYKGSKVHEVSEITSGLQRLAKSEQIVVLALHQLNREVEGRDNKRPVLSDLRDSGSVEQDADIILFPYRAAYYLERMKFDDAEKEQKRQEKLEASRNELEVNIAKQRNGPSYTIELFADMAANAVRDKWRGS